MTPRPAGPNGSRPRGGPHCGTAARPHGRSGGGVLAASYTTRSARFPGYPEGRWPPRPAACSCRAGPARSCFTVTEAASLADLQRISRPAPGTTATPRLSGSWPGFHTAAGLSAQRRCRQPRIEAVGSGLFNFIWHVRGSGSFRGHGRVLVVIVGAERRLSAAVTRRSGPEP